MTRYPLFMLLTLFTLLALAACQSSPAAAPLPADAPAVEGAATDPDAGTARLALERCAFAGTGATLAFEAGRANFTCDPVEGQEVVLLGTPTLGAEGWEIQRAVLAHGEEGFSVASSASVPITHIELASGMQCAWAGSGATLAFYGERVSFTCTQGEEAETVLVGDVQLGDQGWQIREMALRRENGEWVAADTAIVPIAALSVVRP